MSEPGDDVAGDAWRPPPEFEEYRIVRRLGGGAMGEVYLAEDVLLRRLVAVKFVRARGDDGAALERFYIEARAIARLQHPHVVAVHRVGRVRQRPYLVSEYVAGSSLDQVALPLPPARVIEIGVALASGLAAAHRRGVLHRDLKPANAIISDTGDIKLLDFGLAKLLDEPAAGAAAGERRSAPAVVDTGATEPGGGSITADLDDHSVSSRTRPGSIVGSPLYMAPELWRGEPATAASDLYALGILLYELGAGRAPYDQLSLTELQRAVEDGQVAPLATVAPAVPPALARIVDRCLRRDPAERLATADGLRRELDALRVDPGVAADVGELAHPYRGLRPFRAEHRRLFFGREDEAAAIVDRLRADPFVLVAGDSGIGKSSLCAAGVLPRIADRGLGAIHGGDARAWSSVELVPGRRPLAALALALAPALAVDEDAVLVRLRDDPAGLPRELRRRLGDDRGLIVYVDQLEELITVGDAAEAALAAEALAELAARGPNLRLLATARNDFLTRLTALPGLGAVIAPALHLLGPLTDDGVRDAIVGPARAAGVAFESDALIGELAASAAGGDGLPLLQFALAALWQGRERDRAVVPASALIAIGGVGGALGRHADGVVDRLRPAERGAARRLLLRLVTADGTRVRRSAGELDRSAAGQAALEALVRERLIVAREGEHGTEATTDATYELAHEALLSAWPTLRAWLSGDVERRAVRERLERAAGEWHRLGRPADALWGPRQLAELTAIDDGDLGGREAEFAATSRRALRRRRWGRRALVAGVVVAAALVYAGTRIQARRALARRVDAQLAIADRALAQVPAVELEAAEARRVALAGFDAATVSAAAEAEAETAWARQRERAAAAVELRAVAEGALETALLLDPGRAAVRRRFAELLFARAEAAERDGQRQVRDLHAGRLALHDRGGALARQWTEPAHLGLDSVPAATVELARYADDDGRQLGAATPLGVTPLAAQAIAPGSYLLTLTAPGRVPVRYPIALARGETRAVAVDLLAAVPSGFVHVPRGRFLYGAAGDERIRTDFFRAQPLHAVELGSYLIARHEVTFADWIEFVAALSPAERVRRLPSAADEQGLVRLEEIAGGWRVTLQPEGPGGPLLSAASGEVIRYPARATRRDQDWLRLPVSGISWDDVLAYAAWLDRTGRVPHARPCDEREWERAARGADDRSYPHGDRLAPADADFDQTYGRTPGAYGPDEVGTHPASDSPFGVADLVGNVWEWARAVQGDGVVFRSASFYRDRLSNLVVNRNFGTPTMRNSQLGARMCADVPRP